MLERNVLNLPLSIEFRDNATLTGKTEYEYDYRTRFDEIRLLRIHQSGRDGATSWVESEYDYNYNGNPISTVDRNGVKTFYLWGYNGLYPVAKIVNADYAKIKHISGLSEEPLPSGLSEKQIEGLYKLSNCEVSVYDYQPFVGISMMIDSDGIRTYYGYNKDGKLTFVHDGEGNLQSTYLYNIKHTEP
jgi:YD repeat-containing protein